MRPFVVVPCSGSKRPEPHLPAGERYTGSLHRLARDAAARLTTPEFTWIASARYGLLGLTDDTEPYDRRIEAVFRNKDDKRQFLSWVHCGAIGMHKLDPDCPVIALVPTMYAEALRATPLLAPRLVEPLAGCAGIGEMRHRLAMIRDTGILEAA